MRRWLSLDVFIGVRGTCFGCPGMARVEVEVEGSRGGEGGRKADRGERKLW